MKLRSWYVGFLGIKSSCFASSLLMFLSPPSLALKTKGANRGIREGEFKLRSEKRSRILERIVDRLLWMGDELLEGLNCLRVHL